MERASGILMPMSSLPSPYGIGTMGREAYRFIDFLKKAGQKYWQLLPLGPTSYGDSPYASPSTFAGNPYFIDLDMLIADGLLEQSDVSGINWGSDPGNVDYGAMYENRFAVLRKAYLNGREKLMGEVETFAAENSGWLDNYALFMSIKAACGMKALLEWPDALRLRDPEAIAEFKASHGEDIEFWIFVQYLFFSQWDALRAYAREKGISFIGDVPIYVAMDSADIWSEPEFFQLDEDGFPTEVSGVPPDDFTADGQLWGNPLYDWDRMKQDGFGWWIRRIEGARRLYDVIRIDHFRGLASYWAVPYGDETARNGVWRPGPGMDLVRVLTSWFYDTEYIAENLGFLTPDVKELLEESGLPGMNVLEFAFDAEGDSDYLPHNIKINSSCYAGTHDNSTVLGWLGTLSGKDRKFAEDYLGIREEDGWSRGLIRAGMASPSKLFVAQMQDVLELGADCRMNTPGSPMGNWRWRMRAGDASAKLAAWLRKMTELYRRIPESERLEEELKKNSILWLSDAERAFREEPGCVPVTARLKCFDGAERQYTLYVPEIDTDEKRGLVCEYLTDSAYNMLSMVSGSSLTLYVPEGNSDVTALVREACAGFFDSDCALNRVIRVARRLCAVYGLPEFELRVEEGSAPDGGAAAPVYKSSLAEKLLRAVERSGKGFYCGIDIGGTDIKVISAADGKIDTVLEYDWNPSGFATAEETIGPILALAEKAAKGRLFDGIGVSYPDIVVNDRIAGGETSKTAGIRENSAVNYEDELRKLAGLKERLGAYCADGAPVHIINDGHIAAFTAAAEIGCKDPGALRDGIAAFAMGTDLGTGYINPDGTVPPFPTESYAMLTDLGSRGAKSLPPEDLRSAINPALALPCMTRYLGQESAFRYAYAVNPALLEGFLEEKDGRVGIIREPDLRKPCLEALTEAARSGDEAALEVFRSVGRALGSALGEMNRLLSPVTGQRYIFGRFVKKQECFEAICEGCRVTAPGVELLRADEDMAETPLMKALAADGKHTVAQFGQAIGAIYYTLSLDN